ncbi:uncharacterized protein TNCV_541961 [Trichonephila clavipes]|nr:uncharacterized protein TNCV_541961 [Trichonephila clavipes]
MKEGLIALNYECSKCNERMGLYERKSAVLDGDFEWVCSTIASQNIYGRTPMIILLTMRPSRLFVKIRCHAVASTRKRSAVRNHRLCEDKLLPQIVQRNKSSMNASKGYVWNAKLGHPSDLNWGQPVPHTTPKIEEEESSWSCGNAKKRRQLVERFAQTSSVHGTHFICSKKNTSCLIKFLYRWKYQRNLKLLKVSSLGLGNDVGNVSRRCNTDRPRVTMPNEDRCLAVNPKRSRRNRAFYLPHQLSAVTDVFRLQWLTMKQKTCDVWTSSQGTCVMFSDESKFNLKSDPCRTFIWRTPHLGIYGEPQIPVTSKTTSFNCTVTVVGAMSTEFVFMDNDARLHQANIVTECLHSEFITPIE